MAVAVAECEAQPILPDKEYLLQQAEMCPAMHAGHGQVAAKSAGNLRKHGGLLEDLQGCLKAANTTWAWQKTVCTAWMVAGNSNSKWWQLAC
jgi:hypothetical protein